MVPAACLTPLSTSFRTTPAPGNIGSESYTNPKHIRVTYVFQGHPAAKYRFVIAKAASGNQSTKPNSMICADCDGNGAVLCSQCKGSGVNSVDLFNGEFKAGDSCWLCGIYLAAFSTLHSSYFLSILFRSLVVQMRLLRIPHPFFQS